MLDPMLIKSLKNIPSSVTSISLNNLEVEDIQSLTEILIFNTNVTSLTITESNLDSNATNWLAHLLLNNKNIKSLYLVHNNLGAGAVKNIANALQINTTLKVLDISNNNLGVAGIKYLAEVLKSNHTLETLDLTHTNFELEGLKFLADALTINTQLSSLVLKNNNFGLEGIEYLAEALKINKSLSSLNLRNTGIGPKGVMALAEVLKINTKLKHLILSNNEFGYVGAEYLAEALKINNTLTHLYLEHVQLGPKGAKYIGDFLLVNQTLKWIDLCGNDLGGKGIRHLTNALKNNTTLTDFIYFEDIYCYEIPKNISDIVQRNEIIIALAAALTQIINNLKINENITIIDFMHLQNDIEQRFAHIKKLCAKASQLPKLQELWQQKQDQIATPILNQFKADLSSLNCSINFASIFAKDITFLQALEEIQKLITMELPNPKTKFFGLFSNPTDTKAIPPALKSIYLKLQSLSIRDGLCSNLIKQLGEITTYLQEINCENEAVSENCKLLKA